MTAEQLLSWFNQAAPGDRISYYRGNLGQARGDKYGPGAREIVELADAARSLGMPQSHEILRPSNICIKPKFGQGLAHLTQRRVSEGRYDYFITKAAQEVLT